MEAIVYAFMDTSNYSCKRHSKWEWVCREIMTYYLYLLYFHYYTVKYNQFYLNHLNLSVSARLNIFYMTKVPFVRDINEVFANIDAYFYWGTNFRILWEEDRCSKEGTSSCLIYTKCSLRNDYFIAIQWNYMYINLQHIRSQL